MFKRMYRLPWLCLGLMVMLTGCGGGDGDGGDPSRFEPQIINRYSQLVDAIENESLSGLMSLVSPFYLNDGTDYTGFRASFDDFFDDYDDIRMDVSIEEIEFNHTDHPTLARVEFDQYITAFSEAENQNVVIDDSLREMIWRFEDGRWVMLGNQEESPAALSLPLDKIGSLLGDTKTK